MIRALVFLFVVALCCSRLCGEELFPTARHGLGELRYINSIPVVTLVGTPEEIGEQHAALLAKHSSDLLGFPKRLFIESGMEFFYPLAAQAGRTLMLNAPERYQREINAAANQGKLDLETLAVGNTLLELRRIGCSTLIVEPSKSATGKMLFGRNFDFPPFGVLDRFSVVSIVKPTGKHAFVSIGYPGMMGVISGMNDAGLCVATLDVYDSADGSSHFDALGVPMTLTFRQILEECTTVAEAEALLKRTRATTQANLAVCDPEQAVIFEITPKQIARRDATQGVLPCTNHFRMPGLIINDECWRYDRLQTAGQKSALGVADIQAALHSANQGEMTLQTMVFEPTDLVLHLALGTPPSSAHTMQRLELKELLAPAE